MTLREISIWLVCSPLLGAIISGFFGKKIGRTAAHRVTIGLMMLAFVAAVVIWYRVVFNGEYFNDTIYTWATSGAYHFVVGFLLDKLSCWMLLIVTFVSLLVHIYSIGYMSDDSGYQRFFAYMSLFTFAMLMLVLANNFLQLFFGWEGVGLVSYLLIGFWYHKDSAVAGGLKAFLVNRVGDLGFIIAIAAVFTFFQSIDYLTVFTKAHAVAGAIPTLTLFENHTYSVITIICIALFVGAMGKSAQMPLHVWLPESMEGPTPISALIHAATMVTAGIFMVARMSPLFELSTAALSVVLVVGATTAFFTGLIAVVQNDIKRVIAYSTLSQLGYMTAALGASAYSASIFHLLTHACFKALLFLGAGSVIIGMHHEQDIRKMGGLRRYMPITYITFLIGSLALAGIPPFSGFFSKDSIIEAVQLSTIAGHQYAYFCLALGAFVTALYTFRVFFLTFHGKPRWHVHGDHGYPVHESPWVICLPLVLLAIPSIFMGAILIKPMLFSQPGLLGQSIEVAPQHDVLMKLGEEFHGWFFMILEAFVSPTFWFAIAGVATAWFFCIVVPGARAKVLDYLYFPYFILLKKFGFDEFYQKVVVRTVCGLGELFYRVTDMAIIDDLFVNGSGRVVQYSAKVFRKLQSGYLYHYAFIMLLGLMALAFWFVFLGAQSVFISLFTSNY